MSSAIYVTIKLEPFLQQFLCGHFQVSKENFSFPNGHILSKALVNILRTLPENYQQPDYGEHTLEVEIPYNRVKDPFYYRYISPTAQSVYAQRVKKYFDFVFHERIVDLRHDGFEKKQCVEIFLDENHLDQKYYDRLIKDFQRWRNKINQKKFRDEYKENTNKKASKKNNVLSCV